MQTALCIIEKSPAFKQKNPAYIIKKSPTNMVPGVFCIMKRALYASKKALHISGKDPYTYDARSLLLHMQRALYAFKRALYAFKRALHTSGKRPTYMIPGAFCFMQRALHECSATCHTPRMTSCRYCTIEKPHMHYCTKPRFPYTYDAQSPVHYEKSHVCIERARHDTHRA